MPAGFPAYVLIPIVIAITAGCAGLPDADAESVSDAPAVGRHRDVSFTQAPSCEGTLKLLLQHRAA